jgi:tetratricopeptide (TPR) repeat protein
MSSSSDEPRPPGDEPASNGRLDSWKEIAAYLRRSVRSAKRWEKEEGLPVHRHLHGKRDSVYAYGTELDAWWTSGGAKLTDQNGVEEAASPLETETLDGSSSLAEPEGGKEVAPPFPHGLRKSALIGVGFALAIVLVGLIAWLSRNGSGSAIGSLRRLPFKARDWILVADFENRTGEPLLDGTLEYALGRELSNSRYVNVVPRARIGDALRLMRKPLDTRLDAAVGREVCLRDGQIRALLTGRVEKFGTKYLLSVDIVEPKQGTRVSGFTQESSGREGSLTAVRQISDRVRKTLGENLPSESSETPLVKVTTSNLRALQLYSRADSLMMSSAIPSTQAAAEELLRQAVAEDPNFASAYIHLAFAINNQRRPVEEFRPYAETALRLSETTTERERLFIRGSFSALLGKPEKAIPAYEALLSVYPDDFWGTNNLANLYGSEGRFKDARELEVRRADLRPWDFQANQIAASDLVSLDRARSQIYVERARALVSPAVMQEHPGEAAWLELFPAAEDWLDGNLTGALQVADGMAAKIDSLNGNATTSFAMEAASLYLTLGRLEAAARCFQKIPDPLLREEQLARVAFFRNDRRALEQHLAASEGTTYLSANTVILLARVGLLPRAGSLLTKIETLQSISDPGFLRIPRGELALARGDVDRGIADLEEGTRRVGVMGYWVFLGSETLATALEKKGDLTQAVQVLERASEKRSSAAFEGGGACWLRNQLQRARLYRETGRERDARAIEGELRKLLALADSDHPILRELERLRASETKRPTG